MFSEGGQDDPVAATPLMERQGVPIDAPALERLRTDWNHVKSRLVREVDKEYGVFVPADRMIDPGPRHTAAAHEQHRVPRAEVGAFRQFTREEGDVVGRRFVPSPRACQEVAAHSVLLRGQPLQCEHLVLTARLAAYSANGKVEVLTAEGKFLEEIEVPEGLANLCFGGEDNKTWFITARPSLYRIRVVNAAAKPPGAKWGASRS